MQKIVLVLYIYILFERAMEIESSRRSLGSIRCIVERDDLAVFSVQLVVNSVVVFVLYSHILLRLSLLLAYQVCP